MMMMSAQPSIPQRLNYIYVHYAIDTKFDRFPKKDFSKFCEWEFCPNPKPTTFHITTIIHTHRPLSPALTIHHQTPCPPTHAPHSHNNSTMQAKHTVHVATSLLVMWQLKDEQQMEICRSSLFFSKHLHSTIIPAEPQDNSPPRNNNPTNTNNHPHMKLTTHTQKQLPTHGNNCDAQK